MTSLHLLLISWLILLIGGALGALSRRLSESLSWFGGAVTVCGCSLAMVPAIGVLYSGQSLTMQLNWSLPIGGVVIGMDALSSFFVILIGAVSLLSTFFGLGYIGTYYRNKKFLGWYWARTGMLCLGMLVVVTARDGVLFLLGWEIMSLAAFSLVMIAHDKLSVCKVGWIYLTATHLGAACLFVVFSMLSSDGSDWNFAHFVIPNHMAVRNCLFVLAVVGFGAKAGIWPFHVWLPIAYRNTPAPVSVLMSGVMIKTGVYGLIRVIGFLGVPSDWWGWVLLLIGMSTSLSGIFSSAIQTNFNLALAYSSIENIGIILIGLGVWQLGLASDNPGIATLGLAGALLHVLNHAIFKSLLFMGAGAVQSTTHNLDLNQLGGLMKRQPRSGILFFVGAMAATGLPLFNGFVSELLIYLAAFQSMLSGSGVLPLGGALVVLSLSAVGGVAAVCYTRLFGLVYLGEPRSPSASNAREVSLGMWVSMAVPAGLCGLLGAAAPLGLVLILPVLQQLRPDLMTAELPWQLLWAISLVSFSILLLALLVTGFRYWLLCKRSFATSPTWDCGYLAPSPQMQYSASSYSAPVANMFRWLLRPDEQIEVEPGIFPKRISIDVSCRDVFMRWLYQPLFRLVESLCCRCYRLQSGTIQLYVLYIGLTVVFLLLLLAGV